MKKKYILIIIGIIAILLFAFWPSVSAMLFKGGVPSGQPSNSGNWGGNQQPVACTEDAKLCPDGTSVGRVGPKCEFAACPVIKEEKTAGIGQRIFNGGVYLTPLKVMTDSRCPANVLCISAGNIVVRTKVERMGETKTIDFVSAATFSFSGKNIVLTNALPARNSVKSIPDSEYRFTFLVTDSHELE